MKNSTIVWIIVVIIVVLGLGWYFYANSSSMTPASSTTPVTTTTTTTSTPLLSSSANSTLGNILVASNGMTLYTFNTDTSGVSTCTGQCATQWPPYTIAPGTTLSVMSGITGSLGTLVRSDTGATQLTYNGMPLYFFVQDTSAGAATGNGDDGFAVAKP